MDTIHYTRGDGTLGQAFLRAGKLVRGFNQLYYRDIVMQQEMILELFGSVDAEVFIEHNFHCDLGFNIHGGHNFYAGYSCTILDMAEVRIGNNRLLGPNVGIYTAGHHLSPVDHNSIVAAGSVVIKDVPSNTVYGGNPAKFIKEIEL